jgi:hypothetical protein
MGDINGIDLTLGKQSEHPQEHPHLYRFRILRNCFVVVDVDVVVRPQ